jgi:thymidylate synthase
MRYPNADSAFLSGLADLRNNGERNCARGSETIEILNRSFLIEDPTDISISNPARKFKDSYAVTEWLWYMSHDRNIRNIGKHASIWNRIADDCNEVESNYGAYFRGQWAWVMKELYDDLSSRRATIAINQPHHKGANSQDYPCTQYVQFFVRNGKLSMSVCMRSNDAVYGFCNDVFAFSLFQQLMLNELNHRGMCLGLGHYHHHAGSFHIYEQHYTMMDEVLAAAAPESDGRESRGKYVLRADITWNAIEEHKLFLPREELTKNQINDFVEKTRKELFQ